MEKINSVFDRSIQIENDLTQIKFQCLSWNEGDFMKNEEEDPDPESIDYMQYEIYISGVNILGQSVCARILGFTPYFYVLVPDSWTKQHAEFLFKHVKNKLWKDSYGLISYDFVKRKKLYPYLAGKQFKFVRLIFSTDKAFNKCKWMFSKKNQMEKHIRIDGVDFVPYYEAFETNIKHLNRFCHIRKIETTGWLVINKFQEDLQNSSAQINIIANWKDVHHDPDTNSIAPITIFSWDIECCPENTEEFPNPELPGDIIKQISVVLTKYGTSIKQKFIFTSSPCAKMKYCSVCDKDANYSQIVCDNCKSTTPSLWVDSIVVESDGEINLLNKFCDFIGMSDPDIIIGFNTWGFDDNYFWKRTLMHGIDISKLSRITKIEAKLIKKELTSSAYGNNEFNYLFCPGRETFDMLIAIRREYKLESFSLNSVSKFFLKEKKNDLPYRILFQKLNGGPEDIAECAAYCIQDSNLTVKLFLKLNMLPNYIEMAKATYVPMEWLLFRGQQCKVFSLIAKDARDEKYVIPVYERKENASKFQGATVIHPLVGLHYEAVAGMDFESLYPSIMMAYNMCYTTIIVSEEMMNYVISNNIPYQTIEWESCSEGCKDSICTHLKQKNSYSFVQIEDEKGVEISNGVRGLLGTILMKLMKGRKATKKLMNAEKDPFMKALYNGKQLAQKVTMNSIYGFTGAENGILPLKPIASSVTATGRKMIDKTSSIAKDHFGAICIYGDSIVPEELISIKNGIIPDTNDYDANGIDVPIEEFGNKIKSEWKEYRGFKIGDLTIKNKEYKDLEQFDYTTLTHKGFQKIKKIIRHKTNKKIYKITAKDKDGNLHSVRVTEGHSLILENGKLIMPDELKIGDILYDYLIF